MKLLSAKKAFILALVGLYGVVHGAATSSEHTGSGSTLSLYAQNQAQFIMLLDQDAQERPDSPPPESAGLTFLFAAALRDPDHGKEEVRIPTPVIVSDSIVYNFLMRNKLSNIQPSIALEQTYVPVLPIEWGVWDIYKVKDTGFTFFVPKSYTKDYQDHGLSLDSESLIRLPNESGFLLDFFNKSGTAIDMLMRDFASRQFEPAQLRKIFKTRSQEGISDVGSALPIWNIIILGYGGRTVFADSTPKKKASIAGMNAATMQQLFEFFNDELYVDAVLLESVSTGDETINLPRLNHFVGNKTIQSLNFTVIVESLSDAMTRYDRRKNLKQEGFFEYLVDSIKSIDSRLSMLAERHMSQPESADASRSVPQIWVPGGYRFKAYQDDTTIKVLTWALVAAHEDEKKVIEIPSNTKAILLYPDHINVPMNIYKISGTNRERLYDSESAFPSVAEMISRARFSIRDFYDPRLKRMKAYLGTEFYRLASEEGLHERPYYPQIRSMIKTPEKVYHSFKRINLKKSLGPEKFFEELAGVMHFVKDAFVDKYMNNSSDIFFLIDELKGPNDISLLLESLRVLRYGSVSNLEMELRPFVGKSILLQNLFVHLGSDSYDASGMVRIGFLFGGKAWLLNHNPLTAWAFEIAWKFTERPVEEHMQEYTNYRSKIEAKEAYGLTISAALKKRLAREQAMERMKVRIRGQVESMFKGAPLPMSSSSATFAPK